jgi:hypothetical protein
MRHTPPRIRAQRRELERAATAILRAADRRRRGPSEGRKRRPAASTSPGPQKLSLADLGKLRKMGLVP